MVWPAVKGEPSRHNPLWNFVFETLTTHVNLVTCKRSITFELLLKGILNIYMKDQFFLRNAFNSWTIFLGTFAVFRNSDSLACYEISNQNHHRQTGYNYNILTQIFDNFLERNTTRLTWKLLQYGVE